MSKRSERGEQQIRLELQEARLRLAYAAVCLAVLGWYLIPEHRKEQALMRLRRAAAPSVTAVLAQCHQVAVRRAMERELAGQGEDYTLSNRIHAAWQRWDDRR